MSFTITEKKLNQFEKMSNFNTKTKPLDEFYSKKIWDVQAPNQDEDDYVYGNKNGKDRSDYRSTYRSSLRKNHNSFDKPVNTKKISVKRKFTFAEKIVMQCIICCIIVCGVYLTSLIHIGFVDNGLKNLKSQISKNLTITDVKNNFTSITEKSKSLFSGMSGNSKNMSNFSNNPQNQSVGITNSNDSNTSDTSNSVLITDTTSSPSPTDSVTTTDTPLTNNSNGDSSTKITNFNESINPNVAGTDSQKNAVDSTVVSPNQSETPQPASKSPNPTSSASSRIDGDILNSINTKTDIYDTNTTKN